MDPELETAPEQPAQDQPTVTERAALNTATRTLCREHGMSEQFTNNLVDGDLDMIARRAAVNAELIRRAPTIRAIVGVDHTDPAAIMKRQIGGFVASAFGTKPADDEREFFGQTTVQVLRDMNERRGVNTRRMNDGDVIQRAFGTGDAPEFLTGVGNRVVLDAYTRATHPIMQLVQTRTVPDYRPVTFLRDSDFDGELEPVNEHGEFTRTSFGESKLSAQVEDFARGFDVTDKAIRNDDKGVITRVPAKFGAMAAAKDAALVLAVLSGNPVMDDGKTLFHADHSNLDTGNVPISLESVSDGRLAMRSLVGLAGEQLNIAPRYLVVSKELETAGEVFLASIQPTATSDAQPIKLTLIVEPGLPAFQWMLAADPAQAACLAILRLSGAEAPRIETAAAWNTFAMQFRCKHTVNAAAVGWRGLALWASGEDSNSQVF